MVVNVNLVVKSGNKWNDVGCDLVVFILIVFRCVL